MKPHPLACRPSDRRKNRRRAARRIVTGVHYRPLHRHAAYRDRRAEVPVTDALWRRLLLLPLHPMLSDRAQDHVIAAVRSFGQRRS